MEAIEKLSDIETGICDDAHIYELSECMARMFEAVFNLYRVIPCYDQCHLFGVHADQCRISIKIVYSDVNSCCFHIDYDDYVSVVKSEDIIINVDNCDFDSIQKLVMKCLRSIKIKDEGARVVAHITKNPARLKDGESYINRYENSYKKQVVVDCRKGNRRDKSLAVIVEENGDLVITKDVWYGKGLSDKRICDDCISYIL